jgi:hypothetical protein
MLYAQDNGGWAPSASWNMAEGHDGSNAALGNGYAIGWHDHGTLTRYGISTTSRANWCPSEQDPTRLTVYYMPGPVSPGSRLCDRAHHTWPWRKLAAFPASSRVILFFDQYSYHYRDGHYTFRNSVEADDKELFLPKGNRITVNVVFLDRHATAWTCPDEVTHSDAPDNLPPDIEYRWLDDRIPADD